MALQLCAIAADRGPRSLKATLDISFLVVTEPLEEKVVEK